jgi:hypothetical protein
MRARAVLPVLALLALLLAGCASPEPPPASPGGPSDGGANQGTGNDGAAGLGGNASAPSGNGTGPGGAGNASAPAGSPRSEPFEWTGTLPLDFCAPSGPDQCSGQSLQEGETSFTFGRAPLGAVLDLTWTAGSPLTQELGFFVMLTTSCGDGCTQSHSIAEAQGASPLHIEVAGIQVAEGESVAVGVGTGSRTPSPAYTTFETPQDFTVTGNLTMPG